MSRYKVVCNSSSYSLTETHGVRSQAFLMNGRELELTINISIIILSYLTCYNINRFISSHHSHSMTKTRYTSFKYVMIDLGSGDFIRTISSMSNRSITPSSLKYQMYGVML